MPGIIHDSIDTYASSQSSNRSNSSQSSASSCSESDVGDSSKYGVTSPFEFLDIGEEEKMEDTPQRETLHHSDSESSLNWKFEVNVLIVEDSLSQLKMIRRRLEGVANLLQVPSGA